MINPTTTLSRSVSIENREPDNNIQVKISSDHTTSQSRHEETPIVLDSVVASQQNDNIRVNEMTQEDENILHANKWCSFLSRLPHGMLPNGQERQMKLLIEKLWCQVRQLENKKMLDMITSAILFDAVKSGNIVVLNGILSLNPELLLKIKDPNNGQTLLHIAALYQQEIGFDTILEKVEIVNLIIGAVDNDGNNVLHAVALRELESFFKNIHTKLLHKQNPNRYHVLTKMRNNNDMTPWDIVDAIKKKEI